MRLKFIVAVAVAVVFIAFPSRTEGRGLRCRRGFRLKLKDDSCLLCKCDDSGICVLKRLLCTWHIRQDFFQSRGCKPFQSAGCCPRIACPSSILNQLDSESSSEEDSEEDESCPSSNNEEGEGASQGEENTEGGERTGSERQAGEQHQADGSGSGGSAVNGPQDGDRTTDVGGGQEAAEPRDPAGSETMGGPERSSAGSEVGSEHSAPGAAGKGDNGSRSKSSNPGLAGAGVGQRFGTTVSANLENGGFFSFFTRGPGLLDLPNFGPSRSRGTISEHAPRKDHAFERTDLHGATTGNAQAEAGGSSGPEGKGGHAGVEVNQNAAATKMTEESPQGIDAGVGSVRGNQETSRPGQGTGAGQETGQRIESGHGTGAGEVTGTTKDTGPGVETGGGHGTGAGEGTGGGHGTGEETGVPVEANPLVEVEVGGHAVNENIGTGSHQAASSAPASPASDEEKSARRAAIFMRLGLRDENDVAALGARLGFLTTRSFLRAMDRALDAQTKKSKSFGGAGADFVAKEFPGVSAPLAEGVEKEQVSGLGAEQVGESSRAGQTLEAGAGQASGAGGGQASGSRAEQVGGSGVEQAGGSAAGQASAAGVGQSGAPGVEEFSRSGVEQAGGTGAGPASGSGAVQASAAGVEQASPVAAEQAGGSAAGQESAAGEGQSGASGVEQFSGSEGEHTSGAGREQAGGSRAGRAGSGTHIGTLSLNIGGEQEIPTQVGPVAPETNRIAGETTGPGVETSGISGGQAIMTSPGADPAVSSQGSIGSGLASTRPAAERSPAAAPKHPVGGSQAEPSSSGPENTAIPAPGAAADPAAESSTSEHSPKPSLPDQGMAVSGGDETAVVKSSVGGTLDRVDPTSIPEVSADSGKNNERLYNFIFDFAHSLFKGKEHNLATLGLDGDLLASLGESRLAKVEPGGPENGILVEVQEQALANAPAETALVTPEKVASAASETASAPAEAHLTVEPAIEPTSLRAANEVGAGAEIPATLQIGSDSRLLEKIPKTCANDGDVFLVGTGVCAICNCSNADCRVYRLECLWDKQRHELEGHMCKVTYKPGQCCPEVLCWDTVVLEEDEETQKLMKKAKPLNA